MPGPRPGGAVRRLRRSACKADSRRPLPALRLTGRIAQEWGDLVVRHAMECNGRAWFATKSGRRESGFKRPTGSAEGRPAHRPVEWCPLFRPWFRNGDLVPKSVVSGQKWAKIGVPERGCLPSQYQLGARCPGVGISVYCTACEKSVKMCCLNPKV